MEVLVTVTVTKSDSENKNDQKLVMNNPKRLQRTNVEICKIWKTEYNTQNDRDDIKELVNNENDLNRNDIDQLDQYKEGVKKEHRSTKAEVRKRAAILRSCVCRGVECI